MFNLFTKSILQDLLESVDDNYKWKKDELIDVLSRFDLKKTLNKMTMKQLKVILKEMELPKSGTKLTLVERILEKVDITESLNEEKQNLSHLFQNLSDKDLEDVITYFQQKAGWMSTNQSFEQIFSLLPESFFRDWSFFEERTLKHDIGVYLHTTYLIDKTQKIGLTISFYRVYHRMNGVYGNAEYDDDFEYEDNEKYQIVDIRRKKIPVYVFGDEIFFQDGFVA